MARSKTSSWPSDDEVREHEGDHAFTDDGRKVRNSERVGGMAPDADPEHQPPKTGGYAGQ